MKKPFLEKARRRSILTGSSGEMKVAGDLLQKGYHVYHNVSGAGPFDLVFFNESTQELLSVECRTASTELSDGRVYWSKATYRDVVPDLFAVSAPSGVRYFNSLFEEVEIYERE